jgi:hypothetical protein
MIGSLTDGSSASSPSPPALENRKTSVSLFPRPTMPPERGTDTNFTSRSGFPIIPSSASGLMAITCPQLCFVQMTILSILENQLE